MGWHYAIKEFRTEHETYYGLVEVFPDIQGSPHTAEPVAITADSPSDLIQWLKLAVNDAVRYPLIYENTTTRGEKVEFIDVNLDIL